MATTPRAECALPTLNERLNAAIVAYARLARLRKQVWFDASVVEELNESRELDPSGVTTFLLLRGFLNAHAAQQQFTVADVLKDPTGFQDIIAKITAVQAIIRDPETEAELVAFQARMREVAGRMTVKSKKAFEEFLADADLLGSVIRDSKRSLRDLRAVQFVHGEPAAAPLQVNGQIFEFWNINSLIQALELQRVDGATLCLIRDPKEVMASYFVFAIRHGGAITIVSDYEPGAHPLQHQMSRNPGRTLEDRAERHWFPYWMLDLERRPRGQRRRPRLTAVERNALVPYQQELAPIAKLGDLRPPELTWTYLVLEGLIAEYGRGHRQLPELAYTAEMVTHPLLLAAAQPDRQLPVRGAPYVPLELPSLSHETVTAETIAPQTGERAVGHNEWMIERYVHAVPTELLGPVGDIAASELVAKHKALLATPIEHRHWTDETHVAEIEALSPTMFGSREEIQRDRLWLARLNQARAVQALANAEFQREKAAALAWCRARLEQQLPVLIDAAARGEWILPMIIAAVDLPTQGFGFAPGLIEREENIVEQRYATRKTGLHLPRPAFFLGVRDEAERIPWRCPVTQQAASIYSTFHPSGGAALAALFGVTVEELPFGLQHWTRSEPYVGNSILDRLDPADWALETPWRKLAMVAVLPLSRKAYKEARAGLGLVGPGVLGP
jgi:hypothetical protein